MMPPPMPVQSRAALVPPPELVVENAGGNTMPITVTVPTSMEQVQPAPQPFELPKPTPQPFELPKPGLHPVDHPKPALVLPQLPPPRRLNPLEVGRTPQPDAKELQKFGEYVIGMGDPTNTLDLVQNRARLMILSRTPKRIQIADDTIVTHDLIGTKEITLLGKTVGATTMSLWFPSVDDKNKEVVLHYLVRVHPDPEEIERLRRKYKALEIEINQSFKDSVIHLSLVGTKVLISGTAHDIRDATEILRLVAANVPGGTRGQDAATNLPTANVVNTPGQDNYNTIGNANVINMMNITGVQQVGLRVVVAEINRTAARSIGLNLSVTNRHGITVFENTTGSILTPFGGGGGGGGGGTGLGGTGSGLAALSGLSNLPAILDNGQIVLAINALKTMHYAKSLAEPNLVALNGKTASFQAGGEFPVPVVTANGLAGGLGGVSFVPYGVQLNFTPFITDKDRIRLNVSATISTRDTTTGTLINGSAVPGLSSRNFSSTVELREGQTLAVAGLIQTNLGADRDQIPFLAEIPFINRFTGFDRTSSGEQELVILITPELVQPLKCGEPQPRLPGADYFDPSDIEFYLCGRLDGRRTGASSIVEGGGGTGFRSPVMSDYHRIQNYNRCEQIYIFGPTGYQITPGSMK
jgi:pilus assembly protein CpaC